MLNFRKDISKLGHIQRENKMVRSQKENFTQNCLKVWVCLTWRRKENTVEIHSSRLQDAEMLGKLFQGRSRGQDKKQLAISKFWLGIRKVFFVVRAIQQWNRLPWETAKFHLMEIFKDKLDGHRGMEGLLVKESN